MELDYNKEYYSEYGKYIILENIDDERVKIMFLYTKYESIVKKERVLSGKVIDYLLKYFDKEYYSGKGEPVKILSYGGKVNGRIFVNIKYLIYEYEDNVALHELLKGNIRNPYYPNCYNIGCFGKPEPYLRKHVDCWHGMISRCYNKKDRRYKYYGGSGVTVCKRWLCFEYFLKDIKLLKNYDKWLNSYNMYQLDKDILQSNKLKNEKIYSPETCMFVLKNDNINQMILDNVGKSNYVGVYTNDHSTYSSYICVLGKRYYLGSYTNIEAAANAYNWFIIQNGIQRPLNNVQPMSIEEMNSYLSTYHGINKCIDYIEFAKVVRR